MLKRQYLVWETDTALALRVVHDLVEHLCAWYIGVVRCIYALYGV
jgi:hypothetical protein